MAFREFKLPENFGELQQVGGQLYVPTDPRLKRNIYNIGSVGGGDPNAPSINFDARDVLMIENLIKQDKEIEKAKAQGVEPPTKQYTKAPTKTTMTSLAQYKVPIMIGAGLLAILLIKKMKNGRT